MRFAMNVVLFVYWFEGYPIYIYIYIHIDACNCLCFYLHVLYKMIINDRLSN